MNTSTYDFDIPIGDWSNDGHGKYEYFQATASKPFKDVCFAFKAAKVKLGWSPEQICSEYEEMQITDEDVQFLKDNGYTEAIEEGFEDDFHQEELAEVICWFINQGDPDINVKLIPKDNQRPILRNWDYCDIVKDREGLDSFGYGMFI